MDLIPDALRQIADEMNGQLQRATDELLPKLEAAMNEHAKRGSRAVEAALLAAYRAGREDAARDIENDPDERDWPNSDPWWNGYDAAKFERAVEIARGATSLGRSVPSEEHNTERGSE